MEAAILFNKKAGSSDKAEPLLEYCSKNPSVRAWTTESKDDLPRFIEQAEKENVELLIVAGGDGSIHSIIEALEDRYNRFKLGIIPLGTGNDLSRTLGIPLDPMAALTLALKENYIRMDLIEIRSADGKKTICVNHASAGLGGQIEKQIDEDAKQKWKSLAYARTAATVVAAELPVHDLSLSLDGKPAQIIQALNLIVANGRTAGGGFRVAPQADPSDRWMDIVIVKPCSALELAGISARLLASDYTNSDSVLLFRAKHARIESKPAMRFGVDGDFFTESSIECRVIPQAIQIALQPKGID